MWNHQKYELFSGIDESETAAFEPLEAEVVDFENDPIIWTDLTITDGRFETVVLGDVYLCWKRPEITYEQEEELIGALKEIWNDESYL